LFVLLRVSAPVLNSRRLFIYLPPRSHIMLWWQAEFGFFILRLLFFKKKKKKQKQKHASSLTRVSKKNKIYY
jgi:hypothetical protein